MAPWPFFKGNILITSQSRVTLQEQFGVGRVIETFYKKMSEHNTAVQVRDISFALLVFFFIMDKDKLGFALAPTFHLFLDGAFKIKK